MTSAPGREAAAVAAQIAADVAPAADAPPGLHIIGLGLCDETDISLKGLAAVKSASAVFLETYTSILSVPAARLSALYGRPVVEADREFVEENAHAILDAAARPGGAAFLVVGDAFGATTHSDLWLRARQRAIPVRVVHNASVLNAVGVTGLQLYRFGETISVCFWTESFEPDSYFDKLAANRAAGLHTLCLLDIKTREPTLESLARGRKQFEPPRFMTVADAVAQLLAIDARRGAGLLSRDTKAVGVARLAHADERVVYASMADLLHIDFGRPLHSLVIPAAHLHFHEEEVLSCFALDAAPHKPQQTAAARAE